MTLSPRRRSVRAKWEPTKPAAPVTSIFIGTSLGSSGRPRAGGMEGTRVYILERQLQLHRLFNSESPLNPLKSLYFRSCSRPARLVGPQIPPRAEYPLIL